tara:strand:+ start:1580 stop:1852 length:273 start_codon:yes stop_codon:yes gene_type:complete
MGLDTSIITKKQNSAIFLDTNFLEIDKKLKSLVLNFVNIYNQLPSKENVFACEIDTMIIEFKVKKIFSINNPKGEIDTTIWLKEYKNTKV